MLIEFCVFNNCQSSSNEQNGGCIYMYSSSSDAGSCVLNKCCANQCYSKYSGSSYGQFIYTYLSCDDDHINQVLDSSIINSIPPSDSTSRGTLYLRRAIITIKAVNLSNNTCSLYAPIYCYPYSLSSSSITTCCLSYCSIRGNEAKTRICVSLENSAQHEINNSNIIENQVPSSSSYAVITILGTCTIRDCTILDNTGQRIFYASSKITLINCTIDVDDLTKTTGNGNVDTDSWKPSPNSFIIPILGTQDENEICVAQYDIIGSLSPMIQLMNEKIK